MGDELYSTAEVADNLDIAVSRLDYLIRQGEVSSGRIVSGRRVFTEAEMEGIASALGDLQDSEDDEDASESGFDDPDDDDDEADNEEA